MIFPNLGVENYDEKDRGIINRMESFYTDAININQSFWGQADTATRFYNGDQSVFGDLYGNLYTNQRQFSFNRIRRIVNMVSGYQQRNTKSTTVTPVENGDEETADQFSKIMMWISQQESMLDVISDSFEGALITGMNLLHVWMDYRRDPISGDPRITNESYNSFLIDPYFRNLDLSDCNGLWKRSFLTKQECLSLLPDKADMLRDLVGQEGNDFKFQFMPESYNYGMKNLLTYDEFYYRDYRNQKLLSDTQTGETLEWTINNDEGLRAFLAAYPMVEVLESVIPTVRLAIVVQGKVMYHGAQPSGIDSYPFVPVVAYYSPQTPYFPDRIQGIVKGLQDAQYLYNRRKIIELQILESQINSGWKYKENALVNPKDVFLSGQGKGLALKEEAMMTDVEQIIAPSIPPSMIELSRILGEEIAQISGVNEELLGSAVDEKAGILSMLRQGAGLTTLQGLFRKLDQSQKLLGKLIINLVQANFMPGKVKRIIEAEPSPQFYNKAFGRYDAVVEEGLNTSTQRQMAFAQMLQLREVGVPVPDSVLIESCTLQNKKQLIEAINQQQQQAMEAQQQQQQAAVQEQQARTELAYSRAMADKGLGLERVSRIDENRALAQERRAEAYKDEEAGMLNLVKALKEIDDIDIAQIEKLLALSRLIKSETLETNAAVAAQTSPTPAQ